jgi:hypothetical protein
MTDVLGISLAIIAVTLLLDHAIPRRSAFVTGVWFVATAVLAARHSLFPGIAYAIAALTASLSIAILAAPLAPRALRLGRTVAVSTAIVGVIAGVVHG